MSRVRIPSPAPCLELLHLFSRNPDLEVLHDWVPFVVHSLRDVLAAGADRAVSLPDRLASVAAVPADWHRRRRSVGAGGGDHQAAVPRVAEGLISLVLAPAWERRIQ